MTKVFIGGVLTLAVLGLVYLGTKGFRSDRALEAPITTHGPEKLGPEDSIWRPNATDPRKRVKAFYIGHSLLVGNTHPNFHIPYNVGLFAAASGHTYETHGQIGWGTALSEHWEWQNDNLAGGPNGFEKENLSPFYAGRNARQELASGEYNLLVFTDVNGNARGEDPTRTIKAALGFIRLARKANPDLRAVLYSCWNGVEDPTELSAVQAWRDATYREFAWWQDVTRQVNARLRGPDMLLAPVSKIVAELTLEAAQGKLPRVAGAKEVLPDGVHPKELGYYAAAATIFATAFQEPVVGKLGQRVAGTVSGARVDYELPAAVVKRVLAVVDHMRSSEQRRGE